MRAALMNDAAGMEALRCAPDPCRMPHCLADKMHSRQRHYVDNYVTTTKYNLFTCVPRTPSLPPARPDAMHSFVPKNLLEFFRVVANLYFLLISILQARTGAARSHATRAAHPPAVALARACVRQVSTDLSPTNKFTTITPLIFVLLLTMAKQGFEDYKRHKADVAVNARRAQVVGDDGELLPTPWRDVLVGDVVLVSDRDEFCADMVILATSEEEGKCFVETANLDGETNLKRRNAVERTSRLAGLREVGAPPLDQREQCRALAAMCGYVECEAPNNRLYNFVGQLVLADSEPAPVGVAEVALRGCVLRSCRYALGLVVYTGAHSKLMMNSRPTPSKQVRARADNGGCAHAVAPALCAEQPVSRGEPLHRPHLCHTVPDVRGEHAVLHAVDQGQQGHGMVRARARGQRGGCLRLTRCTRLAGTSTACCSPSPRGTRCRAS